MPKPPERAEIMGMVHESSSILERLHAVEARPATMINLLGIPDLVARTMSRYLNERDGRKQEGQLRGRAPEALGPLMALFRPHLEASAFHQVFLTVWHVDDFRFRLPTFLVAYELHIAVLQRRNTPRELTIEHALIIADHAQRHKIKLTTCGLCQSSFTQTVEMVQVGEMLSHGECPFCRQLGSNTGEGGGRLRISPTSRRRFMRVLGKAPGVTKGDE